MVKIKWIIVFWNERSTQFIFYSNFTWLPLTLSSYWKINKIIWVSCVGMDGRLVDFLWPLIITWKAYLCVYVYTYVYIRAREFMSPLDPGVPYRKQLRLKWALLCAPFNWSNPAGLIHQPKYSFWTFHFTSRHFPTYANFLLINCLSSYQVLYHQKQLSVNNGGRF